MPADPDCVFCKIIAGQIPAFKFYEDDAVFAFLDIGPLVTGHTLVIPKEHHATIMTTPPEVLSAVNARLPKITRALLAATNTKACHVLINNGSDAMQSVHHLHYHILPRHPGDSYKLEWNTTKVDPQAAQILCKAVVEAIKKE